MRWPWVLVLAPLWVPAVLFSVVFAWALLYRAALARLAGRRRR
jgi:hypothetical protein